MMRLLLSTDQSLGASMALRVLVPAVDVARGAAAFVPAADGEVIGAGDRVRTDATGTGVITFFDGSSLALDPSTEIGVVAIDERSSGVIASFTQAIGRTWSSVNRQTGAARYQITTPAATAVVRGTAFEIIVLADGVTTVRVLEGTVAVSAQGVTVVVQAAFETTVITGQPPPPPTRIAVAAFRVALRSSGPGGPFVAVIDGSNRTCGVLDPASLGIGGPTRLEVTQIPQCTASGPAGGVATAEIGSPADGSYAILILAGRSPTATFSLEISGALRGALSFHQGIAGDIVSNELQATQISLTAGPEGGPALSGSMRLTRVTAGSVSPGTPRPPGVLAFVILLKAAPVALAEDTRGAPLNARPALVAPPGVGASLGAIFGSGALMLAAALMFKEYMRPLYFAASLVAITAFFASTLSLLFFYRDFLITVFYTIGRLLR